MKGLLIKDFKLLKNQRSFLGIVLALCLVFLFRGRAPEAVISYATAMIAILATTTVSYDEMDHGMNFIFTFPVSRKYYVLEKYLFGILLVAAVCVMGIAASLAVSAIRPVSYDMQECMSGVLGGLLSSCLLLAVMLPIQLKYGSEKTRLAVFVLVGGIVLVAYMAKQMAEVLSLDFSWVITRIQQFGLAEIIVGIVGLAAVILGISYLISSSVMMKKQF